MTCDRATCLQHLLFQILARSSGPGSFLFLEHEMSLWGLGKGSQQCGFPVLPRSTSLESISKLRIAESWFPSSHKSLVAGA